MPRLPDGTLPVDSGSVILACVRWWLRNLALGAAVGLAVGVVVGGTLGRAYMRLVFLAEHDAIGFRTAMGAIVGQFTRGGTTFIYVFAGFAGVLLGLQPGRLAQGAVALGMTGFAAFGVTGILIAYAA